MKPRHVFQLMILLSLALAGCTTVPNAAPRFTTSFETVDAFEQNKQLGRGVNMGNMLEAPSEGEWGITLKEEYLDRVKEAGFSAIRVPIRWSAHTAAEVPYTVDPAFFQRIDDVIAQSLARDLIVVINVHHFDELILDTKGQSERFIAIWQQIATRYRSYDAKLLFEVLNEPHDMGNSTWNKLLAATLTTIRASNPTRNIVVGPLDYYGIRRLADLELPDDPHLIVSIHYYAPFQFTHQGAEWVSGAASWLGTTWEGKSNQKVDLAWDLDLATTWAEEHKRPLYLGEFGAYSKADLDSRARWTAFVAREAEKRAMSWAYWEFGAGFGVYDPSTGTWNSALMDALLPKQ